MMPITRSNLSTNHPFEEQYGYSRAVRVGEMVFVSGTVGRDYDRGVMPETARDQMEQIVKNLELAVTGAGGELSDIVQIIVYVTSAEVFEDIGPVLKRTFGDIGPVNTALQVSFPFPDIKVEVSATAICGCGKNVELLKLR